MGETKETTLYLSPILRSAMAARSGEEDFDEALLRVLKAQEFGDPAGLLGAVNRILELEAKRTRETRDQVIARLLMEEQGPRMEFRQSPRSTTVTSSMVIKAGGKEYHSLEELPPELREAVTQALPKAGRNKITKKHTGCCVQVVMVLILSGLIYAVCR